MPRAAGLIALQPMGNAQDNYYLINLHSGKRIIGNVEVTA